MKGLITKTLGGFFFVADNDKNIHKTSIRGKIRKEVYPGDYVEFYINVEREEKVIEKLYKRDNYLAKPRIANLDQVLVMHSFEKPEFDFKLMDRFLVMVEAENLKPIIIINKKDLKEDDGVLYKKIYNIYKKCGYKVYSISVKKEDNLQNLISILSNKINVIAGPSGVGKSSFINKIIPAADLPVNSVSERLKRGIHTTKHVELLPLDDGGWIADTPGFTSLSIDNILPQELGFLYPDFKDYLNQCKFNMCSHTHEPHCAVKEAVNNGEISEKRYKSYEMFFQELKEKEETYD